MAGQPGVQLDEIVTIMEYAQIAVIDLHRTRREAFTDDLYLFQITNIEVAMLELADLLQGFQLLQALFKCPDMCQAPFHINPPSLVIPVPARRADYAERPVAGRCCQ